MDNFETTDPVEGEALPSAEVTSIEAEAQHGSSSSAEAGADDEAVPDEGGGSIEDSAESDQEELEEVERNGRKAAIPKWLKPELMMQADYTRKTQELADARRAFEAEREAVQQVGQDELSAQVNLQLIDRQIDHFSKMDWNAAQDSDAAAAQKAFIQFQLLKDARRETQAWLEQLRTQRSSREQQDAARRLEACNAEVAKHLPEWSPPIAARLKHEGRQHFGFSADEVDGIDDPRIILALHAAVRWKEQEAKERKVEMIKTLQKVRPAAKSAGGGAAASGLDDRLSAEEWLRRRNGQLRKRG